jgi:hypothetical protein
VLLGTVVDLRNWRIILKLESFSIIIGTLTLVCLGHSFCEGDFDGSMSSAMFPGLKRLPQTVVASLIVHAWFLDK